MAENDLATPIDGALYEPLLSLWNDDLAAIAFQGVSAPTPPSIAVTPTDGSSVTRTASVQVDVTDDSASLGDVTIWATYADGSSEVVWDGSDFTALFSGSTSGLALGTRYTFACAGFGWPTTAVTISVKAADPTGAQSGVTSVAYTVSNPPAAPSVSFSPASGGSMARSDAVQVDVTDDEGASSLALVRLYAVLADASERLVAAGATIKAPFTAGSSRSSLTDGYRYVVAWDSPGWPSTTAGLRVDAVDGQGRVTTSSSWSATITDPPAAPVVGGFSPASSGSVARTGSIQIEVTDDEGEAAIQLVTIEATDSDGGVHGIYNGSAYASSFSGGAVASITDGKRFTFAHVSPGWDTTALTFRTRAVDAQGRITVHTTYTLTISDPPAAPVIGNFLPADSGTTTRAGTVRIDVTDDEGAAALAHIQIDALLSDSSVVVVYDGADFTANLDDGSTKSSISGGFRFLVVYDGDGWPSETLDFLIRAEDVQGRVTIGTLSLTITDPPAPPDVVQPTVTVISPTPPGPIGRNDPVKLQVTDPGTLRRVKLYVTMGDEQYVIHNGYTFRPRYSTGSTVTDIDDGFEYVLLRSGGWLSAPTFEVWAIDNAGNER